VPGVAVEELRAGEKLGIDTARAVADEVDVLDARELLTNAREVLKERSLPMTEAVGRERRDRDDGNRIAQGLLQEPSEHRDQPVREVVEAPEAREAEEARNEDHDIGRLHRQSLPQAATSASGLPDAVRRAGSSASGSVDRSAFIERRARFRQEPPRCAAAERR